MQTKEEHQTALHNIQNGLSTKVRVFASDDSCPVCRALQGTFTLDNAPALPHEGCSHPGGCRCVYAPVLDLFGP